MIPNPLYHYFTKQANTSAYPTVYKSIVRNEQRSELIMIKNPSCIEAHTTFHTQHGRFTVTESHLSVYQHYDPNHPTLSAYHHSVYMHSERTSYVLHAYFDALGTPCYHGSHELTSVKNSKETHLLSPQESRLLHHTYITWHNELLSHARYHIDDALDACRKEIGHMKQRFATLREITSPSQEALYEQAQCAHTIAKRLMFMYQHQRLLRAHTQHKHDTDQTPLHSYAKEARFFQKQYQIATQHLQHETANSPTPNTYPTYNNTFSPLLEWCSMDETTHSDLSEEQTDSDAREYHPPSSDITYDSASAIAWLDKQILREKQPTFHPKALRNIRKKLTQVLPYLHTKHLGHYYLAAITHDYDALLDVLLSCAPFSCTLSVQHPEKLQQYNLLEWTIFFKRSNMCAKMIDHGHTPTLAISPKNLSLFTNLSIQEALRFESDLIHSGSLECKELLKEIVSLSFASIAPAADPALTTTWNAIVENMKKTNDLRLKLPNHLLQNITDYVHQATIPFLPTTHEQLERQQHIENRLRQNPKYLDILLQYTLLNYHVIDILVSTSTQKKHKSLAASFFQSKDSWSRHLQAKAVPDEREQTVITNALCIAPEHAVVAFHIAFLQLMYEARNSQLQVLKIVTATPTHELQLQPEACLKMLGALSVSKSTERNARVNALDALISHTIIGLSDESRIQPMIQDLYLSPLQKAELSEYCMILYHCTPEHERATRIVPVPQTFALTDIKLHLPAHEDLTVMFERLGFWPTFYEPIIASIQSKEPTPQPERTHLSNSCDINVPLNPLRNQIFTLTFQTDIPAYQQLEHCRDIPKQSLNPLSEYVQTQINNMPPSAEGSAPTAFALSIDYHSLRYVATSKLSMFQAMQAHQQKHQHPHNNAKEAQSTPYEANALHVAK